MAGPGGGPPRKSHTKSRKGCKTCKKRHIRCDENFPQCLNCTKHNCLCDYTSSPPLPDESSAPQGPDLLPSANMGLDPSYHFQGLSREDLRLVYHLLSIHQDMQHANLSPCTLWVQELPSFLKAAEGHDFVMSAVLAFAATHLAWLTNSAETSNLAYYHRGVSLKGLHEAIGRFSCESSDAILAASILLSWQISDWNGWNSLMQGISTILASMESWRETSVFASFIHANPGFFSLRATVHSSPFVDDHTLSTAINEMRGLSTRLTRNGAATKQLNELSGFAESIQSYSAIMRSEQIFAKLQTMRAWLFWTPIAFLSGGVTAVDLLLLAQLYSLALAVDASFPELRGAALGSLTTTQIDQIGHRLRDDYMSVQLDAASVEEAMQFPNSMAQRQRHRLESTVRPGIPQRTNRGMQHLSLGSTPTTPGFSPGTPVGFNPSAEDRSVPASPFLRYGTPASRRHSQLIEASPKQYDEGSFDGHSMNGCSFRDDSPAYSSSFHEDDHNMPAHHEPWWH